MKQDIDVLLVDDDKDICAMLEAILQYSGFSHQTCGTPDALYRLMDAYKPKIIVMDMLLSGADGRDTCRELKHNKGTLGIKIMMMSAHPDAEDSCRKAGADEFISKPFDMDQFIQKIGEQL